MLEIRDVTKLKTTDTSTNTDHLFWLVEHEYNDGKLFAFMYDDTLMDVKPSMRGVICVVGEGNKKRIPNGWGYGVEPLRISHRVPRKPHYARDKNFMNNPRKCLNLEFEFNPKINWEREVQLFGIIMESYLNCRHPKVWNDPEMRMGLMTIDPDTGSSDFTDYGRIHSNVVPFPKLKQDIFASMKGGA